MATKMSHFVRPLVALVALVAAMAAILIAYSASPTHAAGSCSTTSGTTTCTFGPTGSEDTFEVPEGVSTIHVVATGAPGGVGESGGPAGRGARVSADLAVSPGPIPPGASVRGASLFCSVFVRAQEAMACYAPTSLRDRLDVGGAGAGDEATVAQGMGGETTPAPAGYPTLPDPILIG
jgi:hypothetical protein